MSDVSVNLGNIRGLRGVQGVQGVPGLSAISVSTRTDGYYSVAATPAVGDAIAFVAGNSRASGQSTMQILQAFQAATVTTNECIARGDLVYAALHVSGFSISASAFVHPDNGLAILPSGYRPVATHRMPCLLTISDAYHLGVVDVETDGNIQTRHLDVSTGTVTAILFNFSFLRA